MIINGDEFENFELRNAGDVNQPDGSSSDGGGLPARGGVTAAHEGKRNYDNSPAEELRSGQSTLSKTGIASLHQAAGFANDLERQRDSSGYASESGDMLRELVKNKDLIESTTTSSKKKNLTKMGSVDSDISDSSIMVSRMTISCICLIHFQMSITLDLNFFLF